MNDANRRDEQADCDAILELVADYAFGLTTDDEARLVESRLNDCPEAGAQLAEYRHLQDEMRMSITQVAPPPALRVRLMATAFDTKPTPTSGRSQLLPLHPGWLAAAAAVALLVLTNIYWLTRVEPLPDRLATFVIDANDVRWARLPAEAPDNLAATYLMWNPGSQTGMMYAEHFEPLGEGEVYQLWLTGNGVRTPVGAFTVNDAGEAAMVFEAEAPIGSFAWAWVTVEPVTGSEQPSDHVVTGGEL